jgi:HPt (histidine-containing phosphotransfer) domain-containing protein
MECGMDGYVSKPVAIAELQNVLQRAEELAPVFALTAAASRACSPMIRPRVLERDRLPKRPVSSPPHNACATPVLVAEGVKSAPTSSPVPFPKLTAEAPGSRRSSGGSQPPAQENRAVKGSVLEDRQTLDLLKEANVLKDVALLFIDQAESAIKDMETSSALGDSNRLRFVAHSFCSSAGSVGAKRLCAMVRDVERRAELEHVVPSVEYLVRINEEIRLACAALRAECGDCISVYSPPSERALQATAVVAAHAARPVSLDPIHPLSPDAVFFQRV